MAKILGLDLGTNSIGFCLRDTDDGVNIIEQMNDFGSIVFQSGVGNSKTGEYSYAAERTKHRSSRRLYQARKYRIWETLAVLIEFGFCPLSTQDLDQWRKYDKKKGLNRKYPVHALKFEQWVRLDFNGDGNPDYINPYELREELVTVQLDFSQEINRFKLGRALYHIAQRRGFKSSKGETLKEADIPEEEFDIANVSLKKSEEKKSSDLVCYMQEHNLKTVACAFAKLLREEIRVRSSNFQAVRSQYKDEIRYIFEFQKGLDTDSIFFSRIYSDKKNGCIFFKRPLRSQKGAIGACTLEPNKSRCSTSHPEYEKFRAFAFINNIKYRKTVDDEWHSLSIEQKIKLYNEKFLLTKSSFKFEVIRKWLEKEIGISQEQYLSKEKKTINYSDKTNVSGCPISGRLKHLLGENWEEYRYQSSKISKSDETGTLFITYSMEDIWHICFSFDDEENIAEFGRNILNFNDKQIKEFINLWLAISEGYSMLSLKAIRNINRFLVPQQGNDLYRGFIYTEAALLGKIPEILGLELWNKYEREIIGTISECIELNRKEKCILNIVNALISQYKSMEHGNGLFAYQNTEYLLDDSDRKDIEKYTIEAFGEKTWAQMEPAEKDDLLEKISNKYQLFFASSKRDYFRLPKLGDSLKKYLANNISVLRCDNDFIDPYTKLACQCAACKKINKIYHPSAIEFYKPAQEQQFEYNGTLLSKKLLESPVIGSFKNPMAMRTLHQLRKLINYFIKEGIIEEDTRIVVETARELNDANMRRALKEYQNIRETENKKIAELIRDLKGEQRDGDDIDKARLLIEQNPDYLFDRGRYNEEANDNKKKNKVVAKIKDLKYKKDITKYRLWLDQGMQCVYTGRIINLSDLFDENSTDFEHTIPRSQSFDNSLANLTVCDTYYNRNIKKNRLPTQLPNYSQSCVINGKEYLPIEPRLKAWKEKVEQLKSNVEFWKKRSKLAQTKDLKDDAIYQKHLWQMELDYWQNKLSRFTMTEVVSSFKHSQLNDTRLITKYAYHYLKSVFSKVEVQKGCITADFRKILGVQSVDEKKNREKHSHHAIDAAILTLIPVAAKRDKLLELFYKIQEFKKINLNTECLEKELQIEMQFSRIKNISSLSDYIEKNILINHVSKDQALTPAKRRERKRGKINLVDGKERWIGGDCIRGRLHKDSFFGAIKQSKKDYITSYESVSFVIRRELQFKKTSNDKGFASLDDLHSFIVDENLFEIIKMQCEGKSFKDSCEEGFYMIDKKGNRVNRIRHVRCYVTVKNPLPIKKQIYLSDKDYKQFYYAEVGDLYAMCKYYNEDKTKARYDVVKLFEVCENRKYGYDVAEITEFKNVKYYLDTVLHVGTLVLLYNEDANELRDMSCSSLSERLYVILGFESDGRINLKRHICAKLDKDLKDEAIKSFEFLPDKIRQNVSKVKFLVAGKDFQITPSGIITFEKYD